MAELEGLRDKLKRLSLNNMVSIFEDEANKASKSQMSYTAFLARLVDEEVVNRTDRSINARVAKARFPAIKTLELFDFSFQPSLPATRIKELAELGFIKHADNVLFVGPTGTGKTHLSIALGLKACNQRKGVLLYLSDELA